MKFPESALAHRLLDGLTGIEVGGSAHNPFNIPGCRNVDFAAEPAVWKALERELCGAALPVDVVADAAALPFADASLDFVLSSHQLEHHWDPIAVLAEWWRVVRPGGTLFLILPHKDRCPPDDAMPTTTIEELAMRRCGACPPPADYPGQFAAHRSYWDTEAFVRLVEHLGYPIAEQHDVDDKARNGFTIIIRKPLP